MKCWYFLFMMIHFLVACAQTWDVFNQQGKQYYQQGNYKEAAYSFEKAVQQAEKEYGKKHQNYLTSCANLGLVYSVQGRYTEAEALYKENLQTIANTIGKEHQSYATTCNSLAELYKIQGRYTEAEPLYKEALQIRSKTLGKEHPNYATTCNNLADLYRLQGRYAEAEPLYKESLQIRAKVLGKEHPDYAYTCNNLGLLYYSEGNFAKAEPLYMEALKIRAKTLGKSHPDFASSCNNLASLYYAQGYYPDAETLYKKALEIRANVLGTQHPDYASSCNNLAGLYYVQGRYAEAEPLYQQAIEITAAKLGKQHPNYAAYCNNLAGLYEVQGRYPEAEKLYLQAIDIKAKVLGKNHPDYALSCNNLALLYYNLKRYSEAEPLYKQAMEIKANSVGKQNPEYAACCNNLAGLYYAQGRYAEAEALYKEALEIRSKVLGKHHPDYASVCNNLGGVYEKLKRYSEAEPLYKIDLQIKAITLGKEHPDYAASCVNLAGLYVLMGRYNEAEPLFRETIEIKFKELQNNFKNLSESEKERYIKANIEKYFNSFQTFASIRYKDNPAFTEYAYNLTIETKGLILHSLEKIKNTILNSKDPTVKKMYAEWKQTKNNYVKALSITAEQRKQKKINLDSLANRANELEKQLALKSEVFAQSYTSKPVTWKEIQHALKPDQAAVEIIRFEPEKDSCKYAALVVKKKSLYPEWIAIPGGVSLETEHITDYRRCILGKIEDTESYDIFWKPLKNALQDIKTVFFSPDGIYHQINLNTLLNPETKQYVSDEIEICQLTNTKDLTARLKLNPRRGSYLFGNPQYNLGLATKDNEKPEKERTINKITQLPGAEQEVKLVAGTLTTASQVQVFLGGKALEEQVKKVKNPRILHIATHGYFKKEKYQSSTQAMLNAGLLFAGVIDYDRMSIRPFDKDDGKLTAFEVMNMELDSTELVVLSACETGLGEASKEGVYGLQRAFKVAGAHAIIMSLWKVNDEATQLLMTKFYDNWQQKGMSKRSAFQSAQREVRRKYKEPYYWGAFVMIE